MKLQSLCISIPAYNEEAALPAVLERGTRTAAVAAEFWEILVIDDGSRDRTPEILREFGARCPNLRVVRHERNLGFPATVREILTMSRLEWTFLIPGDGQIPPEELDRLLPYADRYDLIYGWRRERADPLRRRLTAWVYNALVSLYLGRRIYDVDTGLLFRSGRLRGLQLEAKSVFVQAEFLAEALRRGLRHVEVPIRHERRIGGHPIGGRPGLILHTAWELFRYSLRKRRIENTG